MIKKSQFWLNTLILSEKIFTNAIFYSIFAINALRECVNCLNLIMRKIMLKRARIALVLASLVSTTALADGSHATTSASGGEDHLVLKVRAGWLGVSSKTKDVVKFKNGYTGELALGYFFTDNIAVEGSVGYGRTKIRDSNVGNKSVGIIPVSALVQYHFAPEASVSPYVGLGYSYQFISSGSVKSAEGGTLKLKNGGGVVGQIGLDIPYNDTMGFNIDAKYTYKAKHNFKATEDRGSFTIKNKLSTTAVTAGVTFSF